MKREIDMRVYLIWEKGKRLTTEERVLAGHKTLALIKYASHRGLKTFQCDGAWTGKDARMSYKARR